MFLSELWVSEMGTVYLVSLLLAWIGSHEPHGLLFRSENKTQASCMCSKGTLLGVSLVYLPETLCFLRLGSFPPFNGIHKLSQGICL